MKETLKLRSGATVPSISIYEAQAKNYLDRSTMAMIHLAPSKPPVAYTEMTGCVRFWFDSENVVEAEPDLWYAEDAKHESLKTETGAVIGRMTIRRAGNCGYYTKERLKQMNLEVVEEPVAFTRRNDKSIIFFYDKQTTVRMPLMCARCGKAVRYKKKLCADCYEEDMKIRRAEGDAHRGAYYGMKRERVLFFDLELTGFYDHDEIISISICDATGRMIMNTLVKPAHTKRWKRTEKIHGITPEMVKDAPSLVELTPTIKEIFAGADNIIAYGVSTDYSHIKYIYATEKERAELHKKTRCCANEFIRYIHEHRPDVEHGSLTDAMACFEIEWEGTAHNSDADTIGCMRVWEKLFPHYYEQAPSEEA